MEPISIDWVVVKHHLSNPSKKSTPTVTEMKRLTLRVASNKSNSWPFVTAKYQPDRCRKPTHIVTPLRRC